MTDKFHHNSHIHVLVCLFLQPLWDIPSHIRRINTIFIVAIYLKSFRFHFEFKVIFFWTVSVNSGHWMMMEWVAQLDGHTHINVTYTHRSKYVQITKIQLSLIRVRTTFVVRKRSCMRPKVLSWICNLNLWTNYVISIPFECALSLSLSHLFIHFQNNWHEFHVERVCIWQP